MLALFADLAHAAGGGPVAYLGCGPGYVTAHLNDVGIEAFGADLSPIARSPGQAMVSRRTDNVFSM
ncbi:hypothetical protein [Paractinoplanes maris]|uniref:hypothetical protein n=1 Tax=Paractinoplanes maris TaxID=1734446 RepID=UPI0020206A03|nr:hypothetical protein [Actinoplanes maris]